MRRKSLAELLEARNYSIVTAHRPGSESQSFIVFTSDPDEARHIARRWFDSFPDIKGVEFSVIAGHSLFTDALAELCISQGRTIPSTW